MLHCCQRNDPSKPPAPGGSLLGLLTALLFAFHVNYIPVHVATASHLSDTLAAVLHSLPHSHDHVASPSEEPVRQDHPHAPHAASDHALVLRSQSQSTVAAQMVFLPVEPLPLPAPEVNRGSRFIEHIKPPGKSPPDRAQPRAPPIA